MKFNVCIAFSLSGPIKVEPDSEPDSTAKLGIFANHIILNQLYLSPMGWLEHYILTWLAFYGIWWILDN